MNQLLRATSWVTLTECWAKDTGKHTLKAYIYTSKIGKLIYDVKTPVITFREEGGITLRGLVGNSRGGSLESVIFYILIRVIGLFTVIMHWVILVWFAHFNVHMQHPNISKKIITIFSNHISWLQTFEWLPIAENQNLSSYTWHDMAPTFN